MKYTKGYYFVRNLVILILVYLLCIKCDTTREGLTDTVSPVLHIREDISYLTLNEEYDISYFVESIYDRSNLTEAYFILNQRKDAISFNTVGEHSFLIQAQDRYGNISNKYVSVIVNDVPSLVNVRDRLVLQGEEFDALRNVLAVDRMDGTISDKIKVNTEDLDCSRMGTYEITYSITDSCGATSTKNARVLVCNETLYERQAEHKQYGLTKEELEILHECNYFRYEALHEPDYDKALELTLPALLNLESDKAICSGVIAYISPEYIYCLSVEHGMTDMRDGAYITFFNGESIYARLPYIRLACDNEISLFRIPVSLIPTEDLLQLRQISINDNPFYYMSMEEGEPLVLHCANLEPGEITAKETEAIFAYDSFVWQDEELDKDYQFYCTCLSAYSVSRKGESGTAVIDYYGNLAGIVSVTGTVDDVRKDYYLKIDKLDEFEARIEQLDR
ncbi:MAG: DUF5011 domain-containing protein [Lachnospiraceae bacterium]|nr:DUF5011 domain-containing protein [Lachnospiraceae bacterium]